MKLKRLLYIFAALLSAMLLTSSLSFASQASVDYVFDDYTYPSRYSDRLLLDGVDVSAWQGDNIDWKAVKAHGMDFAFIRIGWTGLDSPFSMHKDTSFEVNYKRAKEAGLMVGVYYYSCATSVSEAKKEAKYVLKILNRRQLDLPVVFDFEFAGRIKSKYKGRSATTSNILAFLNYIDKYSSYEPMFYSYRNIMDPGWSPKFKMNLIDNKYKVWIAQYSTDIGYTRSFRFWQYTSSGSVPGIDGRTDCNFWFYDTNGSSTRANTRSIRNAKVTLSKTKYTYTGKVKKPTVTVRYNGTKLTAGKHYRLYYLKNSNAGTAYVMIRGIGKYSNTKLVKYTISKTNLANGGTIEAIPSVKYNGRLTTVSTSVSYKGKALRKNIDYTVHYINNDQPGVATVIIKGKRNFYGSISTTFLIQRNPKFPTFKGESSITKAVTDSSFRLKISTNSNGKVTYKSSNKSIAVISKKGKVTLKGKTGTVKLTVKTSATSKYHSGSKVVTLHVTKRPDKIKGLKDSYTVVAGAEPFKLNVTHSSSSALTFKSSNPSVAKVSKKGVVTIVAAGQAKITVSAPTTKAYEASSKSCYVVVKASKEGTIAAVKSSSIKASSMTGYGYIRVEWKKLSNTKVDYYEVFKSASKDTLGEKRLYKTADGTSFTYKDTSNLEEDTCYYYKVRGVRTVKGETYYTKWSNITAKTYNYTGTADIKKINALRKTRITASSTAGKGYIKIKWTKKSTQAVDCYQILRAKSDDFSTGRATSYASKKEPLTYKSTNNLIKGTRYYYKVRGVKVINGTKYYTKWSNVVSKTAK